MHVRCTGLVLLTASAAASVLLCLLELGIPEFPAESAQESAPGCEVDSEVTSALPLEATAPESAPPRTAVPRTEPKPPQSGSGRIRIRAVDAATGLALESFRVRAANDDRLADRSSDTQGRVELTLSAGAYLVLVMANGYEPTELGEVRIDDRDSIVLDGIRLHRGSGYVRGTVSGVLPANPAFSVELRGDPRTPRRVPLSGDWSFEFADLVSGPYAAFFTDESGRILGPPVNVDVRAGESSKLSMEFPGIRELRVELIDTDGSSLAGEWAARRRSPPAESAQTEFVEAGPRIPWFEAKVRVGMFEVARLDWTPPVSDSARFSGARCGSVCCGVGSFGRREGVDDRPRDPFETLRPAKPRPVVDAPQLYVEVGEDGLVHLDRMPASSLSLVVSCGPFWALTHVPPEPGATRVLVTLSTNEGRTFRAYERGSD